MVDCLVESFPLYVYKKKCVCETFSCHEVNKFCIILDYSALPLFSWLRHMIRKLSPIRPSKLKQGLAEFYLFDIACSRCDKGAIQVPCCQKARSAHCWTKSYSEYFSCLILKLLLSSSFMISSN